MIEPFVPNSVQDDHSSCDSMEEMSVSPVELRHDTSSTQTLSNLSGVTPLEKEEEEETIFPPSLVLFTIPSSNMEPSKQFINELHALLTHYTGVTLKLADASDPGTSLE
jgi:hypothetical protein